MTIPTRQATIARATDAEGEKHARGGWLRIARGAQLLVATIVIANFLVGIPVYYAQLTSVCTGDPSQCSANNIPTPANVYALHQLGLSLTAFAAISTSLAVVVALIHFSVGVLIFWRRSNTWLGLFASLVLIILGSVANNVPNVLVTSGPLYLPYGIFLYVVSFALILGLAVFLLTFPTGQFAPRWSWVMILLWVGLFASFNLPAPFNASAWPLLLFAGEQLLIFGGTIGMQIYRYQRVYTPVQRQQTKWLVFGLSVGIAIEVLSLVAGGLVPGFSAPDSRYQLLTGVFSDILFVSIPLAVGVSILRYRLYDIDVIIRRTLIYGSLTAILVGVYFGSILALQQFVNDVTGQRQQSAVAIVLSTLLIAALFQPLRGRIQRTINRRFFRAKYDAAKTLAAFGATLRNETDLPNLAGNLVGVVDETLHPAHISLWLRASVPTEYASHTGILRSEHAPERSHDA